MDVFDFALEKEKLSEENYRKLAENSGNTGLTNIFNMLAEEEAKHFVVIEQMKEKIPPQLAQTTILSDVKKVFDRMRESVEKFDFDISQLQLYEKAKQIERQSMEFYLEQAEQAGEACQKGIFKKLAHEEQKHFALLECICDFVEKPEYYLENAEFTQLEDF